MTSTGTKFARAAKRGVIALFAAAVASGAFGTARAQEVQITGPLAGAPAVRHMRLYRVNRFNVAPGIGYTLQDEFARSLFLGLEANYHFADWLGIGFWGGYAIGQIDTDLTSQINRFAQVTDRNRLSVPSAEGFNRQVGRILWGVSAHLIFIPLRGKLSIFQAIFVDTDLYVLAGVALFGLEERASTVVNGVRDPSCDRAEPTGLSSAACLATQTARAGRVAPAPMLGVGLSLYANSWFGVALEWRAFPFAWNPGGTDEASATAPFPDGQIDGSDSRTTFNHMFNVAVVFNLPPEQSIGE